MIKFFKTNLLFLSLFAGLSAGAQKTILPDASYNLVLKAPVTTWDEALPLGNGLMGGLLWGKKTLSNCH